MILLMIFGYEHITPMLVVSLRASGSWETSCASIIVGIPRCRRFFSATITRTGCLFPGGSVFVVDLAQ